MSKRSHLHIAAAHPRLRPMSTTRKTPSLSHQPDPSASPTSSFSSVPQQQWVLNCGKQTAAPTSLKRETDESRAFSWKNAHSGHRLPPRGHRVRAPRPNKRCKDRVCHRLQLMIFILLHTLHLFCISHLWSHISSMVGKLKSKNS